LIFPQKQFYSNRIVRRKRKYRLLLAYEQPFFLANNEQLWIIE
jgi:hypothetical protein